MRFEAFSLLRVVVYTLVVRMSRVDGGRGTTELEVIQSVDWLAGAMIKSSSGCAMPLDSI